MKKMKNDNLHSFEITIRGSFIIPIAKLVGVQILFIGLYFLLLWALGFFTDAPLKSGGIILFLMLHSFQFFWSLIILMKWFFQYYQINKKEIISHKGILIQKRKYYSLEKAESVSMNQGILGSIFNFGDIVVELFMSNSRYEVILRHIPSPEQYSQIIEKTLSEFGKDAHPDD